MENMFEHLECANDEEVQYTYEEVVEEANNSWDIESDIPLVPRSTYKDDVPYERRLSREIRQKFRIGHNERTCNNERCMGSDGSSVLITGRF